MANNLIVRDDYFKTDASYIVPEFPLVKNITVISFPVSAFAGVVVSVTHTSTVPVAVFSFTEAVTGTLRLKSGYFLIDYH